jgi:hypothetical protein
VTRALRPLGNGVAPASIDVPRGEGCVVRFVPLWRMRKKFWLLPAASPSLGGQARSRLRMRLVVRPIRVGKDGAHFDQTFFDNRRGVAAAPDAPGAKSPKGDGRGVDERQEPPVPPSFPFHQGLLSLLAPRSDGPSDGTVQAPIQRMKFRGGNRGVFVVGQLGHRLADISIVADDLFDTEAKFAQVLTVQGAAPRDVCLGLKGRRPLLRMIPRVLIAKRRGELRQESRQEEWNPTPTYGCLVTAGDSYLRAWGPPLAITVGLLLAAGFRRTRRRTA